MVKYPEFWSYRSLKDPIERHKVTIDDVSVLLTNFRKTIGPMNAVAPVERVYPFHRSKAVSITPKILITIINLLILYRTLIRTAIPKQEHSHIKSLF